jgi:hypothetical protein
MSLEMLTLARFTEALNQRFRVLLNEGQQLEMELAQVTPGRGGTTPGPGGGPYESFSVIFNAPGGPMLPQGTYSFEHEQMGQFDLFIVPVGREGGSIQYQAVFNRLMKPS